MALNNLHSIEFTPQELEKLKTAAALLEEVMQDKAINLTPQQRKKYGRVNAKNQLLINKVMETENNFPAYHPTHLNLDEFKKDVTAQKILNTNLQKLNKYTEMLSDTKILLDHDNFTYATSYYRYIKLLRNQEVPGITTIYENLKEIYATQIQALTNYRNQKKNADNTPDTATDN